MFFVKYIGLIVPTVTVLWCLEMFISSNGHLCDTATHRETVAV